MTTPYDRIKLSYKKIVDKYNEGIADGSISFGEGFGIFLAATLDIVSMLEDFSDLTDEQKKATAVDLISQFYKEVIEPLQLGPGLLDSYIDKTIEGLIPTFVETVYDAVVTFLKKF